MATYEFYCKNCKIESEKVSPITEGPGELTCSNCGKKMTLVIHPPAILYRAPGFTKASRRIEADREKADEQAAVSKEIMVDTDI